jgi:hypothetical protein
MDQRCHHACAADNRKQNGKRRLRHHGVGYARARRGSGSKARRRDGGLRRRRFPLRLRERAADRQSRGSGDHRVLYDGIGRQKFEGGGSRRRRAGTRRRFAARARAGGCRHSRSGWSAECRRTCYDHAGEQSMPPLSNSAIHSSKSRDRPGMASDDIGTFGLRPSEQLGRYGKGKRRLPPDEQRRKDGAAT